MNEAFGRYRLISVLGQGGMGTVYRAHDTEIDRDVAIKVLPPQLANEPGYEQRFRREAYTAARLTEPHIIPIYDTGEIDGRLYLVMPIVEGTDVGALLRRGPMRPQRAVHIIEQLAAALDAAHAAGLVHRDVKPSNTLVTPRDFVYLIDFGIVHDSSATKLTSTNVMVGTMAYMAPERFNTGVADARSDVYALACVLHECLTGSHPFPGDSMEQQIAAHLQLDPPRASQIRPGVPAAFDAVIATGMAKNPDERYQSANALAFAARQALSAPSVAGSTRRHDRPPPPPPSQQLHSQPTVPAPPPRRRLPDQPAPQPLAYQTGGPTRLGGGRIAAITAAVVIVAVLGIVGGYLLSRPATTSQSPATAQSSATVEPSTPALPATPAEPTTTARTGLAGLEPFVGSWHAHREGLVITANGKGQHTYSDGMENFTLTSVFGDTATGTVDSSSNLNGAVPGDPVTVTLVGNGQGLTFSAGKEQQFPYCKVGGTDPTLCGA
ncbi:serine/threonine-protein kinase [Mycobacterium bourgelatii]|uniref:non-specific serine/threonine protein kinase n=1 Tax=Mycobacterium bourgelatii TaxID=1273442 RepID=A0A7I9YXU8_MYCBU|nr:serine/threonine-protein kinase [Mycobacterium bourgelatii]MCV6972981.1 protein kinase [Mycobacterium bourgelatii]GFG93491.1 hypothetical protein MBOU_55330 [Mycobacterium bourgelatii]